MSYIKYLYIYIYYFYISILMRVRKLHPRIMG